MHDPQQITYFAETDYRNKRQKFGIKAPDRTKHVYAIGKTGMGKSTLLENMAIQDIVNGNGFAFVDPHGSSADALLDYIPEERVNDVIYFAPHDLDFPVSFNVMEDVGYDRRHLVASGLMSAFKKIWVDAWSARMEYILTNTILALLEYPDSTLLGINRMLVDKEYRRAVVENIGDPSVKAFWTEEFAKYTERFAAEATPAIQNKVGQFTSNPVIRNIIGQPKSSFDLRAVMDERKIVIVNLSKGQIGEANANLLGSMLITKLYLAAMSRSDLSRPDLEKLPNFYLYVDEFQSFANESFADILSEARKYKLNLTMAHQYIEQMSEEVRAAVFGNVGTMIAFRVGAFDAEVFEKEFAPQFTAEDMVNLGRYQMYLKLMVDGVSSAPFSAVGLAPFEKPAMSYRNMVVAASREKYGRPRAQIEEDIITWHEVRLGKGDSKVSGDITNKRVSEGSGRDRKTNQHSRGEPLQRNDREAELRRAMSLSNLRRERRPRRKAKGPSEQNVRELRDALASVLDADRQEPEDQKMKTEQESRESQRQNSGKEETPREIPEGVLRKLFEMDSPKGT
ncbi:type IV secretion system DNA-binding domain-containing protein [Candidatus Wolfebacteria bacterium]|nr:type IV secretion system DNA-binding domain-containing protein [Candidatus Wolfebacteria bacterium]